MKSLLLRIPLFMFALAALGSCHSWIKVYSEKEPDTGLYPYYSYAWSEPDLTPPNEPKSYPLSRHAQDRIHQAVDAQMQRFGFQPFSVEPDLLLHYHVVIENKLYYQHEWQCIDPEAQRLGSCNRVRPVYFREGTLILDFMDAKTGRQVWRGVAVGTVENYTPQQWDAEIDEAIRLIFKKLPLSPVPQAPAQAFSH